MPPRDLTLLFVTDVSHVLVTNLSHEPSEGLCPSALLNDVSHAFVTDLSHEFSEGLCPSALFTDHIEGVCPSALLIIIEKLVISSLENVALGLVTHVSPLSLLLASPPARIMASVIKAIIPLPRQPFHLLLLLLLLSFSPFSFSSCFFLAS